MVKILDVEVGTTAYGMMGFNMPPKVLAPDAAVPILKEAFNAGARLWSAAEFYGTPDYNSLHIIAAYFTQYPEDAAHVILSLKIGMDVSTRALTTDEAGISKSYENATRILDGRKKIDILSCARIDPKVPVEVSFGALAKLVDEGKVRAVGLSECSATTITRAAKISQIAAVEVEFSMFTPDILTNGVAQAAKDAGAVIVGYSPLGKGVLTGSITGTESFSENDYRRHVPRFQQEALEHNLKLVKELDTIADRVDGTKGQIALAWTRARSGKEGMPAIMPVPGTTNVKRLAENMKEVSLSDEDVKELDTIVQGNPASGSRYPPGFEQLNWG